MSLVHTFTSVGNFVPVSGAVIWLDASVASDVTLSGSNVLTWRNRMDNVTAGDGGVGLRPVYTTAAQNGRNVITFDGTDDELFISPTSYLNNVTGWTVFVVAKEATITSTQQVLLSFYNTSGGQNMIQIYSVATTGYWSMGGRRNDGDAFSANASTTAASTTTAQLVTAIGDFTNTDAFLRLNGTQIAVNNSWLTAGTFSTSTRRVNLGANSGGSYFNGWLGEVIVYGSVLSAGDIAYNEAGLKRKWGL